MQYGDFYKIVEFNQDVLKKIDKKISDMNLQIEKSQVNKDTLFGRNPNIRISRQAWIEEESFCKSFIDFGQKINKVSQWNIDIRSI